MVRLGLDGLLGRRPYGRRPSSAKTALRATWRLLTPLYGEADAGRIWNRTAVNQLVNVQGFSQSEYDPCYFWKIHGKERVDLVLYVDDGYVLA